MRELTVASNATGTTLRNASDFVFNNAQTRPAHIALRRRESDGWHDVSSQAFADQVLDLARGLIASDIGPGDRVAIMSNTRYEWTLADMALLAIGAIVVPIYETSSAEQVQWILSDSGATACFAETTEHERIIDSVRSTTPELLTIWRFDGDSLKTLVDAGADTAPEIVHARRTATTPSDAASILYTSGTTGRPKGCLLTHGNFIAEVVELQDALSTLFNSTSSTLLFLPLAHVFGRVVEFGALAYGCTLGHAADVKNLLVDLGEFKPSFVLSVPRVFEKVYNGAKQQARAGGAAKGRIFDRAEQVAIRYSEGLSAGSVPRRVQAEHALFDRLVYVKLRHALGGNCDSAISGGAPLGTRLGHFFRGVGLTVYEGYGLTETTAGIAVNRPDALRDRHGRSSDRWRHRAR